MTPNQFGRYEIKGEIGLGGMATVYHAWDPRFEREVAIKVLPPEYLHDPTFRGRFEREAKVIAALEHPGIVPVYDFGEQNGQPYLVMRYMVGKSLKSRLEDGPLPVPEAAKILERITPALDYAHRKGVIHRDLKPDNILFDQLDEPYLSDFGIAKLAEAGTTLTGNAIVGTPAYMSPEQARGDKDLDGRSDIYALGAILFEMLTGQLPYSATTPMGQAIKHITDPVPNILERRKGLPPELQEIIALAMAKRKESRFATGSELAVALTSVARGEPLPRLMTRRTTQLSASEMEAVLKPPAKTPKPQPPPPLPAKERQPEPQPLAPLPVKERQPEPLPPTPLPVKERKPERVQPIKPREEIKQPQAGRSTRPRLYYLLSIGVLLALSVGGYYLFFGRKTAQDLPSSPVPTITLPEELPSNTPAEQVLSSQGSVTLLSARAAGAYYQQPGDPPTQMQPGVEIPITTNTRLWTTGGAAQLGWSKAAPSLVFGPYTVLIVGDEKEAGNAILLLEKGNLFVESRYLIVRATGDDFEANVSNGRMGISYTPNQRIFQVDCLGGSCSVGDLELDMGQRGGYMQGILSKYPVPASTRVWLALIDEVEGITSTDTQTATQVLPPTPGETLALTNTPTKTQAVATPKPYATSTPTRKPAKKAPTRTPAPPKSPTKTPVPPF